MVEELEDLAEEWLDKPIPQTVQTHVSDILHDISHLIADENQEFSLDRIRRLSNKAIFPVESPSQGLILCVSDGGFYIPDNSGRYKSNFSRYLPLLSLSHSVTLHDIKPILYSSVFKGRLKYLDQEVKCLSHAKGPQHADPIITDRYTSKVEFVRRLEQVLFYRC